MDRVGAGRSAYTKEEDQKMIRFLIKELQNGNVDALSPSGNGIWKKAVRKRVTDHTYQSMRDRMRRAVLTRRQSLQFLSQADRELIVKKLNLVFSDDDGSDSSSSNVVDLPPISTKQAPKLNDSGRKRQRVAKGQKVGSDDEESDESCKPKRSTVSKSRKNTAFTINSSDSDSDTEQPGPSSRLPTRRRHLSEERKEEDESLDNTDVAISKALQQQQSTELLSGNETAATNKMNSCFIRLDDVGERVKSKKSDETANGQGVTSPPTTENTQQQIAPETNGTSIVAEQNEENESVACDPNAMPSVEGSRITTPRKKKTGKQQPVEKTPHTARTAAAVRRRLEPDSPPLRTSTPRSLPPNEEDDRRTTVVTDETDGQTNEPQTTMSQDRATVSGTRTIEREMQTDVISEDTGLDDREDLLLPVTNSKMRAHASRMLMKYVLNGVIDLDQTVAYDQYVCAYFKMKQLYVMDNKLPPMTFKETLEMVEKLIVGKNDRSPLSTDANNTTSAEGERYAFSDVDCTDKRLAEFVGDGNSGRMMTRAKMAALKNKKGPNLTTD